MKGAANNFLILSSFCTFGILTNSINIATFHDIIAQEEIYCVSTAAIASHATMCGPSFA